MMDQLWGAIAKAPSHQMNAVASTVMAMLTGLVLFVCFLLDRKPDVYLVGSWLTFLGAWKGINVRQFAIKRTTEWGPTVPPAPPATPGP